MKAFTLVELLLVVAIVNGLSRHDYEIEHGRLTRNFNKAMELQK